MLSYYRTTKRIKNSVNTKDPFLILWNSNPVIMSAFWSTFHLVISKSFMVLNTHWIPEVGKIILVILQMYLFFQPSYSKQW